MRKSTQNNSTYWIVTITVIACLFGLVMVASASQIVAITLYKDAFYFFKRQIIYLLAGGFIAFLLSKYDYRKLEKLAPLFFAISFILLIIVLIPGIGKEAGGSTRWIPLGFFNLQPSEVAKFSVIILIASIIGKKREFSKLEDYKPFILVVVIAFLVLIQPDFGTAVMIVMMTLLTLLACGIKWKQFLSFLISFSFIGSVAIFSSSYRRQRFFAFLNPEADIKGSGFQIIQSKLALGSGGLMGVGLSLSKQKFAFLPAAYTDFIFSIIGEELGLFGALSVVAIFVILTVVGMGVAATTKESFGKALATAITLAIIIQTSINLGACLGIMPITGIPLPLISYGGSSLMMTLAIIGILINISQNKAAKGA